MKITLIGAGAMGGATAEGLIKGKTFKNEDITVSDPSKEVLNRFAGTGVKVTNDNVKAIDGADVVCVCVKPWLVQKVLEELCPSFDAEKQILIVSGRSII